jgi:phosphate transport system substrate-binding protein
VSKRPWWRRSLWAGSLALAITTACMITLSGSVRPAFASAEVNGGGSSFAAPETLQWAADVARKPYNLTINYVNSSSSAGRSLYGSGQYDYGATDVIYNAEDSTLATTVVQDRPFKYVTVSAGGLGFEYNLTIDGVRFTNLELTRKDVCQIFTGEILFWNQLAGTAPSDAPLAGLPANTAINVFVRSDGAGESYVLSQYCEAVDPSDWAIYQKWVVANQFNIGYQGDPNLAAGLPISFWPPNLLGGPDHVADPDKAANGAPAAAQGADNPEPGNSITYVATAYAQQLGAPVASVQNGAGVFTQPTPNSIQLALSYAKPNSLGTFNLDFTGTNPYAYFPSTYSYIIDPATTKTPDSGVNGPLNQWLCYDIGAGQQEAAALDYAPLSAQVTALSIAAIEATPDAPPASQCGTGGPAPVVAPGKIVAPGNQHGGGSGGSGSGGGGGSGGTGGGSSGAGPAGGTGASAGGSGAVAGGSASGGGAGSTGGTGSSAGTRSSPGALRGGSARSAGKLAPGSAAQGGAPSASLQASSANSVSQSAPGSTPAADQALWWVIGGFILAAGATGIAGLTRREST